VANLDEEAGVAGEHAQALLDALAESFAIEARPDAGWLEFLGLEADPACAAPSPACDALFVQAVVERGDRDVALLIPAGFSAAIEAGAPITATLLFDPLGDAVERQLYSGVIEGNVAALSVQNQLFGGLDQLEEMLAIAPADVEAEVRSTIDAQALAAETDEAGAGDPASEGAADGPALAVVEVEPAGFTLEATPDTYQQTVPGYTVMYVFFLVGMVAAAFRLERSAGTLRRQLAAPVGKPTLVAGKLAAALLVGLIQVAVMFAVGYFGFGMELGRDPLALLLLTTALVAAAVALGLLAFTWRASAVLTVPLIVAALLGGCMFPSSWLPPFLRTAGLFVPHTWAVQGYQDLLVRGQTLPAVLPEIGVLLLVAGVAFLIAIRRFNFLQEA
jgi:ABC-2 type transport system permease protein